MPRPARADGLTKFQRYRSSRKQAGLKLARIWVPDPRDPSVAARAQREANALRGAADEAEILDFIEAAMRDFDLDA
jgi:hypothetical protein